MAFRIPHFGSDRTIVDDLLGVLQRRKLIVILTAIATVAGVYAALTFMTERYEAEAQLMVMLGRENAEAPLTVERGGVYSTGVQKEEINSYIQLLKSRSLAEATVDEIGHERFSFEPPPPETFLQRVKHTLKQAAKSAKEGVFALLHRMGLRDELSDRDQAVELVQRSLNVTREGESNVIRVALRLPSAELAKDTVRAMIDLYLDRHVRVRPTSRILPVFDEQSEAYRKELADLQERRNQIRRQWNLSSIEKQRAELLERLSEVRRSIDQQRDRAAALRSERKSLEARLAELPDTDRTSEVIEPNPAVQRIKERLVGLRLERIDTAGRYEEDTPLVQRIDDEIAEMEGLLAAESKTQQGDVTIEPHPVTRSFRERLERIAVELPAVQASIEQKQEQASAIERDLSRLNEGEAKLRMVELDLEVVESKFLTNATRREEARISAALDRQRVANVAVLSPPTADPTPVHPKKLLVMALGVVSGLMLGVGLATLLEWSDDTIHDRTALSRATDTPLLGEFDLRDVRAAGAVKGA